MIIALPKYNDPDAYYTQTNNVIEAILAKTNADRSLETCGPTAAVTLLHCMGDLPHISTPGGWAPQPEDILALWFNDPRNYAIMAALRSDISPRAIMGNEVPQYYPAALASVFGAIAHFRWGCKLSDVITALEGGRGVLATMIKPGHYIACVGYDTETREVIYHDPWPNNTWPARYAGKPGRLRRMTPGEFADNIKPFRVEIG